MFFFLDINECTTSNSRIFHQCDKTVVPTYCRNTNGSYECPDCETKRFREVRREEKKRKAREEKRREKERKARRK